MLVDAVHAVRSFFAEGDRSCGVRPDTRQPATDHGAARANGAGAVDKSLDRAVVLFANHGGLELFAYAGARKTSNGYSQCAPQTWGITSPCSSDQPYPPNKSMRCDVVCPHIQDAEVKVVAISSLGQKLSRLISSFSSSSQN